MSRYLIFHATLVLLSLTACEAEECPEEFTCEEEISTGFDGGQVNTWSQYSGQDIDLWQQLPSLKVEDDKSYDILSGENATLQLSSHFLDPYSFFKGTTIIIEEEASADKNDIALSACLDEAMSTAVIQTKQREFLLRATIDFSECQENYILAVMDNPTLVFKSSVAKLELNYYGQCQTSELGELNGKTIEDIGIATFDNSLYCDYQVSEAFNRAMTFDIDLTQTIEGDTNSIEANIILKLNSVMAMSDQNGRSCQKVRTGEDIVELENSCQLSELSDESTIIYADGEEFSSDKSKYFTKIESIDLKLSAPSDYFELDGKASVQINDWLGTMTYDGSGETPAWEMTNESDISIQNAPLLMHKQLEMNSSAYSLKSFKDNAVSDAMKQIKTSTKKIIEFKK